jgi:uncharacterized protein (DUF2336 family)
VSRNFRIFSSENSSRTSVVPRLCGLPKKLVRAAGRDLRRDGLNLLLKDAACADALASHFVPLEEVVFFPAPAVRALQAADKQHGHADRDQDGENISIDSEPVHQATHIR